jgi:hypothetical protein
MPSLVRITAQGKVKNPGNPAPTKHADLSDLYAMLPVLQASIPLGLPAFAEVIQAEVVALARARDSRARGQAGCVRWGRQRGSTFLADQKVPVAVQRVRDCFQGQEVLLRCGATSRRRRPRTAASCASASSA